MGDALVLRGRYLLTDPRRKRAGVVEDGAIAIQDGTVVAAAPFAEVQGRFPGARVLGNGRQLLLPGLIDAHSHGRGLSPIQKGVPNDFLENALHDWAFMPVLPPELTSALCALRHIRSGCTTLHHNGFDDEGPEGHDRAQRAVRTYLSTGIRLAYSPSIRPKNKLALDDEAFWATLPPELQEPTRPWVFVDRPGLESAYFELFQGLHDAYNGPETRILLSVAWAHGTTESYLERCRETSARLGGIPIHMHTLQSPVQKAYGLRALGKPTLRWLDERGCVSPQFVYSHAIHVTAEDVALLGARGAAITHHLSCNLHMRNGIAPVAAYLKAGVTVAMGMDDKTLNDDEDAVMELRMIHKIHRLATFDLAEPAMDAYTALEIATRNGARVCGFDGELGVLTPGAKADAILVDLERIAEEPWLDPGLDIIEAFVQRGLGRDVATVVVGGKVLMEDRRALTIDVEGLYREVRAACARGLTPPQRQRAELLRALKPHVQRWYGGWETPVLGTPWYPVNSRE